MIDQAKFELLAKDYLQRWRCEPDGAIFSTHSSLLWPVKRDQQALMMKIVDPNDDEAHAGEILRFYDGYGSVRLVEGNGHIQLLERIMDDDIPTLKSMVLKGFDDDATNIICDVVAKLHDVQAHKGLPQNLNSFSERVSSIQKHLKSKAVNAEDMRIFNVAQSLAEELIQETKSSETLLHGDIHHGNILHSAQRGWVAIDPKGLQGPRVYEYANSLCNPYEHSSIVSSPQRMQRQAAIIAERANLNKPLLLSFVFLHAAQCAAWSLASEYQDYWLSCGRTAAELARISLRGEILPSAHAVTRSPLGDKNVS